MSYVPYTLPNDLSVSSVTASAGFSGSHFGDGSGLINVPSPDLSGYATLTGVSGTFVSSSQLDNVLTAYATLTGVSGTFVSSSQLNNALSAYSTLVGVSGSFASLSNPNTFSGVNTFNNDVTGSSARFTQNVYIEGILSAQVVNTVAVDSLQVGDKTITLLSGSTGAADINGAGLLLGSGSGGGDQTSYASILYRNASSSIEVYPNLTVPGKVQVGGQTLLEAGQKIKVAAKTANYSLDAVNDYVVTFNGSNLTGTLPSAITYPGTVFLVKNKNASPLLLTSTAGLIDGSANLTVTTQYYSYTLVSDGVDWNIV